MDRGHFRDTHALLVPAEQRPLATGNGFVAHLDVRRKEQVALRPPARLESLDCHIQSEYYSMPQRNSLRFNPFVEIRARKIQLVNHSLIADHIDFSPFIG